VQLQPTLLDGALDAGLVFRRRRLQVEQASAR
jgi:hypothetical protein